MIDHVYHSLSLRAKSSSGSETISSISGLSMRLCTAVIAFDVVDVSGLFVKSAGHFFRSVNGVGGLKIFRTPLSSSTCTLGTITLMKHAKTTLIPTGNLRQPATLAVVGAIVVE